jgi:hypothetical protein
MSASTGNRPSRRAQRKRTQSTNSLPPIVCAHCGGPVVRGQNIGPLFSAKVFTWSAHPVLSKPVMLRGVVPTDGSTGRSDLSLGDQLRQRAAMGGERERAELAAFEALIAKWISAPLTIFTSCRRAPPGSLIPAVRLFRADQFLWIGYGVLSHARPVVVANVLVLTAAATTTWRHGTAIE